MIAGMRSFADSRRSLMLHCSRCALGILLALPLVSLAQPRRGDWELTLGGVGTSNSDFDEHAVGLSAGVGYFFLDPLELSLRQTLTYVKTEETSSTDASTEIAADWHFMLG